VRLKRILALVLCFAMLFTTVSFSVFAEDSADLTISTADELKAFAVEVNGGNSYEGKTVVLADNIDMEYNPVVIGTKTNPFKGIFDGKGYTVSNLTIYEDGSESDYFADSDDCLGLFGVINTPAIIKNVTVHNPFIVGSSYVGGIVGMGYTGAIENCHVTGEIDIEGFYMVGGINGHGYAKISNCSVVGEEGWAYSWVGATYKESDLEGDNVGGIVGHNGENNDIIGCEVKNVTVSGTRKVGGIVGIAALGSDITDCTVSNIAVETTASEEYATAKASTMSIGGLVGQYQNNGSGGTISGCEVTGLTFENKNDVIVSAGSIAGGFRGTNGIEEPVITVSDIIVEDVSGATNDYFVPNYVATVDGVGYETLQEAIVAAAPAGTVEIVDDVVVDKWIMISETLSIGSGQIITIPEINGLTINGNEHSLTVNAIESASNGNRLFYNATNLNVYDLTINYADDVVGGIGLTSGTISGVTFNGGVGILPGEGDITITGCTFNTSGSAIYNETERDNLVVTDNTFNTAAGQYAIYLRGNTTFTNNTVVNGKVNVVSGSPVVTGNDFGNERFKVYNVSTATIKDNKIDNLVFNDDSEVKSTFGENTLSAEAQAVLDAADFGTAPILSGAGTETDPYVINSLDDLVAFRDDVNAGNSYEGKYVKLNDDINLTGINWTPIGTINAAHGFMGNFDGNGYKIMNLTITNPALDSDGYAYAGLFGITEGIDKNNQNFIKNLTIENVTITTDGHIVAAAIAYPYYTIVDNVTICGDIAITGGDYTSGVLAYTRRCVNASNLNVKGNAGSYITGAQVVGGVISDIQMNGGLVADYSNFSADGLTITGDMNVGGISGIISTQTLNGATVKNVTLDCDDARKGIVAGCLGGASTISNVTTENVTGATAIIGGDYSTGAVIEAKIGDKYYKTLQETINAAKDGDTITLLCDIDNVIEIPAGVTLDNNGHRFGPIEYVAMIGETKYTSLSEAFAEAIAKNNQEITLIEDITLDLMLTVPNGAEIILNLNGKTITGTDNTSKNFSLIDNRGTLTITGDGTMTLTATIDSDWGRYSAVLANNPGGKLIVESGTIEHLGGTDMAYGIDNLTNGKGTYAETIINGGTIKSTYRGIRQFLNGVEAQNILTINGGIIEGENKSIFFHDPSNKANSGTLTVGENAELKGDVYLFVTAGSTEWPVEVSIAAASLAEGSTVVSANIPSKYVINETNGAWGVKLGVAVNVAIDGTAIKATAICEDANVLIIATYKDKEVVGFEKIDTTVGLNEITATITADSTAVDTVKAFLWKDFASMAPVCNSAAVTLGE